MVWLALRDGRRLNVRMWGRGEPCLMLHGFASDGSSWLPFVTPHLLGHRFIAPDLAGFGRSRSVPLAGPCPLTSYAHDVADVLDALGLPQVRLVGISMGAFTALQYMRLYGQARVRALLHIDQGLVIRSASHGLLGTRQPEFFARLRAALDAASGERSFARLLPSLQAELLRLFAEFCAAGFGRGEAQRLVRVLLADAGLAKRLLPLEDLGTYFAIMRAYLERDYDMRDVVAGLHIPVTVLIGGRSSMYPPAGQRIFAQLCPHAQVREVASAGHMLPLEAPLRFSRELRRFLAGTSESSAPAAGVVSLSSSRERLLGVP